MSTATLLSEIARVIREAPNLDDGKNELYAIAQRHIPAGYRVWKVLKEID